MAHIAKRLTDLAIATCALLLASPVMLIIAIAIKLTDWGPVFFVQQRVGKDERLFPMYKFRSMIVNAEKVGLGLAVERGDPRITPIGRFIREYHLDELPQLLNVLLGHMSIVGPRPCLPHQLATYTPAQHRRHRVRPGLTGWAMINGLNELDWNERIALDNWYIDNWSYWLDWKIMFRTIPVVLTKKGVYGRDGRVLDKT